MNIVVEGDATDRTVEAMRRVARSEIGAAEGRIVGQAVAATDRELVRNPDFGRR